MFFKRKAREVPELNTVSTADISFMLLIFFLVTTSINTEKGIKRTLPRITKTQKEALTEVNQLSLLSLTLNQQNQVVVKNAVIPIDSVHILAQQVIVNAKEQHVIKLETNAKATYNVYFKLQEQLNKAYQDAKNRLALQTYHRVYNKCTVTEQEQINKQTPWRVQETTSQTLNAEK